MIEAVHAASGPKRWRPASWAPPVLGWLRLARFVSVVALGLLLPLGPHLLWRLRTPRQPSPYARRFHRTVLSAIDLPVSVRGAPFAPGALLVANHISWTDILVLGASVETAFVARADLRNWPFFGWLARLADTIFVDRHARADIRSQSDAMRDALRRGRVALFPEGTTGDGSGVLPFRSALFAAAENAPVQPVAIRYRPCGLSVWRDGEREAFAWDGDKPFLPHVLRVIASGGVCAELMVLPPISGGMTDRKELALRSRAMIRAALGLPD